MNKPEETIEERRLRQLREAHRKLGHLIDPAGHRHDDMGYVRLRERA